MGFDYEDRIHSPSVCVCVCVWVCVGGCVWVGVCVCVCVFCTCLFVLFTRSHADFRAHRVGQDSRISPGRRKGVHDDQTKNLNSDTARIPPSTSTNIASALHIYSRG